MGITAKEGTQRSMFNHSTSTKETDMTAPVNHEQKQRPAQKASCKACVVFELGAVSATPAAIEVLASNEVDFVNLIRRHARGDFGNVCPDDAQSNREAIENGSCIVSSYPVGNQDVLVITEADRSVTTVQLSSDY